MLEDPNTIIENGVGEIYRGFFRLRQAGKVQEEYNAINTLITMLLKDREYIRSKYKVD